jgi:endonuclease
MQLVRDPDPDAAAAFLQTALGSLGSGRLLQAVADCEVAYQGRARSMLHRGDRIVLIKPDGTLLIHTASKAKPVNWQPPGATFHAALEDGRVVLTAYRPKPEELVKVTFHAIHLLISLPLRDEAALALVGSEADLQELLFARPDLVEAGFRPNRRERHSERGFTDLDGDDAVGRRLVVELKRTTAGIKEAQQLWRYVEPLRTRRDVRGLLIAPRVADKARAFLRNHELEWKELDWERLLPELEAMRRVGQASLGRWD